MSSSVDDTRDLLDKLETSRDDPVDSATEQSRAKMPWKGLLLGIVIILISSGLVAVNWESAEKRLSAYEELSSPSKETGNREVREPIDLNNRSSPAAEPSSSLLPKDDIASGNIEVETVLDSTGYVVARRHATVSSKITGRLENVLFEEGDLVRIGQTIATLDDSLQQAELELAQSEFVSAKTRLHELNISIELADTHLSRTIAMAEHHLVSKAQLDRDRLTRDELDARLLNTQAEIDVARRQLDVRRTLLEDTRIRAPFSGVVIEKTAQPGEVVSPISIGGGYASSGVAMIVDMDSLEVEVDVNEAYLNRVFLGQLVRVNLNAIPNHSYQAKVRAIVPAVDRNKATVRVRIELLENDERVLPNMGVQVGFTGEVYVETQTGNHQ